MTESVQRRARRLDKAFAESPEMAKAVLDEIAERHGRDTAVAALDEWRRLLAFARAGAEEEFQANARLRDEMRRLIAASGRRRSVRPAGSWPAAAIPSRCRRWPNSRAASIGSPKR
jgi:hypothetical protein